MTSSARQDVNRSGLQRITAATAAAILLSLAACGTDDDTRASSETTEAVSSTVEAAPAFEGRLVFARFSEATHELVSAHITDPDGSNETELPLPSEVYGGVSRFSHDGSRLLVATLLDDGRVGTAVIEPDGTVDRILEIPDPTLNLHCSVWSPDDSHLACEGWDDTDETRHGLYQVSAVNGGELVRLTSASTGPAAAGDYTPDGMALLIKRADAEDNGPLMLVTTDGSEDLVMLADGSFENPGRFSPDGNRIATSDGHRIVVLDLDGVERSEIVSPGYNLFGPVWSPDGAWLAYSGGTGGPFADIYVARPDGSEVHQVTETPDNEIDVDWGASDR